MANESFRFLSLPLGIEPNDRALLILSGSKHLTFRETKRKVSGFQGDFVTHLTTVANTAKEKSKLNHMGLYGLCMYTS